MPKINIGEVTDLVKAFAPFGIAGAQAIASVLSRANVDVDDDLRALIVEATAAKAEADRAASGTDPQNPV